MTLSAACKIASEMAVRPVTMTRTSGGRMLGARGRQYAKLNSFTTLQQNTLQGCRLAPCSPRTISARRAGVQLVRASVVSEVGKYLGEAASAIFKPTGDSNVPWSGTGVPFEGRITHHDEVGRLRELYQAVKEAREKLTGCTDPSASNFNPSATADDGTCTYVFNEAGEEGHPESLHSYVTGTLSRLWGNNFKGDANEPDWKGTEFNYGGEIVSQRDIQRLLTYEGVVKKTLEKAEKAAEKQ
ncbi:hypothetical protein WJX72_001898 [[Myrmecia] bisecta]|uniref:Uncharacterized protein n=1 Tax=[Myrmecia] bisecta TaxID=41462 RepID=A0AAW1PCT6_9CHLO